MHFSLVERQQMIIVLSSASRALTVKVVTFNKKWVWELDMNHTKMKRFQCPTPFIDRDSD